MKMGRGVIDTTCQSNIRNVVWNHCSLSSCSSFPMPIQLMAHGYATCHSYVTLTRSLVLCSSLGIFEWKWDACSLLRSWYIKGTNTSLPRVVSSVHLMYHYLSVSDLGLVSVVKTHKNWFWKAKHPQFSQLFQPELLATIPSFVDVNY